MEEYKYNCLEFNGELLFPSFSIYLFEITKDTEVYFYVGMTGDNYYPSARSALHRLAGHINLSESSTQNQFMKGIQDKIFDTKKDLTKEEFERLKIKLHHWMIPGFEKWEGSLKDFKAKKSIWVEGSSELVKYKEYKNRKDEVSQTEIFLISEIKKTKAICLNKIESESNSVSKHPLIVAEVLKIVNLSIK